MIDERLGWLALAGALLLPASGAAADQPASRTGPVEEVEDLDFPPLPPFPIPQPQRIELPNGLVVMLLEDHELPLVKARALIDAGARYEPADKVGLAELTGDVLRSGGAGELAADEMDDFLEAKAAVIATSINTSYGVASMSCLAKDFPQILAVFADVLRRPRLPADRLEIARTAVVASIARQNDNPQSISFREIDEIIYGESSPYGRSPTYATVQAVTREDLTAWHQAYFHPNRTVLGLVGDFDSRRAMELIRRHLGDWPRGPERRHPDLPAPAPPAPEIHFVAKEDVTQSSIAMGTLGIRRDNPDYYAIELLNQVFSGSGASRLFNSVRTQKGLAYAVFGQVGSAFDHRGRTLLWMSTKVETTAAGLEALLDETRGLVTRPPDDQEVERARSTILSSFIFNSDSREKTLDQQLLFEYFGYPLDWLSRYREGIDATTLEAVRRAAAKYLVPEELTILVVGPGEGLDRPLSSFGRPVVERDVTIPPPPSP